MEWLLVISALAFAAQVTKHPLLATLTYLSVAGFGVHTLFVLPEQFGRSFPQLPKSVAPLWRRIIRLIVYLWVVGCLVFGAFRLTGLARELATGLSKTIGG
jgi:hypothetical protein